MKLKITEKKSMIWKFAVEVTDLEDVEKKILGENRYNITHIMQNNLNFVHYELDSIIIRDKFYFYSKVEENLNLDDLFEQLNLAISRIGSCDSCKDIFKLKPFSAKDFKKENVLKVVGDVDDEYPLNIREVAELELITKWALKDVL